MFTIIGGDGKEYGPATAEQIRSWITAGRANLETKAKAAGSDEWRRLGDYPEFAAATPTTPGFAPIPDAPTPATPVSSEPITGPIDTKAFAADLIARSGKIDVFSCLDRGFKLWTSQFLSVLAATWLIGIVSIVAGIFLGLTLGRVPFASNMVQAILAGLLNGGLYYYFIGRIRGETRGIGNVFAGFSRKPGALILASLITTLLAMAAMQLFIGSWFEAAMKEIQSAGLEKRPPSLPPFTANTALGLVVGSLISIYISISFFFALPLIIDRKLNALQALAISFRVVSHQWFRVFFVTFLATLVVLMGLIGFLVGIFFTLPLFFASVMYAYEDMFNPKGATPATPTPTLTS